MEKKPDRSEIITMTLLFALTLVLTVERILLADSQIFDASCCLFMLFLPVACNSAFLDFLIGQPLRFYACVH